MSGMSWDRVRAEDRGRRHGYEYVKSRPFSKPKKKKQLTKKELKRRAKQRAKQKPPRSYGGTPREVV